MFRFVAAAILAAMLPINAIACSCFLFADARNHVYSAYAIFEGVAMETSRTSETDEYQRMTFFRVTKVWKGDVPETVPVFHQVDVCCICGIDFQPGKSYKIIAHRIYRGSLATGKCFEPQFDRSEYEAVLESRNGKSD